MGLFRILTRKSRQARVNLIRELAKRRTRNDFLCNVSAGSLEIESMTDNQLMSLPEARIALLVDKYIRLNEKGVSNSEAFSEIEADWPLPVNTGELPKPLSLEEYLKHRLPLEYQDVAFSPDFIEEAMVEALVFSLSEKSRAP